MRSSDTTSLSSVIEQDLSEVKEQLFKSAFSGHELLAEQAGTVGDIPLAKLLFITASLGTYRPDELKHIAVGLELLRLAAEKHYPPVEPAPDATRNFYLVCADYYYARAITLATRLNRGIIVEHMVNAIAELAEAQASGHENNATDGSLDEKRFSLFKAAVKLGSILGECPSSLTGPLVKFAISFGFIYEASGKAVHIDESKPGRLLDDARNKALAGIENLPPTQYHLLGELVR